MGTCTGVCKIYTCDTDHIKVRLRNKIKVKQFI